MKSNKLAVFALLLWLVSAAVFAWLFVRGNTVAGSDGRAAVVLAPGERNLVLSEMRGLLAATHGIIEGVNQADTQRVTKAARAAGMANAADVNPALMAKLPLEFKALGMSVHRDMDEIAKSAEGGAPATEILKLTANVLMKCVACHSAWQIKASS